MPTIGAAVSAEVKDRFEVVAGLRGTTSSRLAAALIRDFLDRLDEVAGIDQMPVNGVGLERGGARSEQVFVRLDAYYFSELGRLAAERQWYRGTYLANLFYAHVDRRPVLCISEIDAVRQVARQLADMGRNINQIAKQLNASNGQANGPLGADVDVIRMLIDLETTTVKELLKANLRGWGGDDGEA
ncbi:plasmid mobilization relaxosome protein MobC [Herbaspirillum sp. SJZ107]|uniref:plasmid mobilization relaxosome protein MobC n=1 Tax=Herbaspirillum sp. SJZ107 TaxID=2572881 RepID=UPI0011539AE6|nr:plasmid mobilization relaxosome protein MobC [Herbaspirillum sp. SJZ107]TQK07837.1 mobilization protein MobC [Herbaspirillum sp. SJZ107]